MLNENILFKESFVSGYVTVNGQMTWRYPLTFQGVLTVKLTSEELKISSLRMPIYEEKISNIKQISINRMFTGMGVGVTAADGKGFAFRVEKADKLLECLQRLQLPLRFEEINKQQADWLNHPITICVAAILMLFGCLGIYSVVQVIMGK